MLCSLKENKSYIKNLLWPKILEEGLITTTLNSDSSHKVGPTAQIQTVYNLESYFLVFFCNEQDKLLLFFCTCGKSLENVSPTLTQKASLTKRTKNLRAVYISKLSSCPQGKFPFSKGQGPGTAT